MKLFHCPSCEQVLFFENVRCERCGHTLAFLPERGILTALAPVADKESPARENTSVSMYRALGDKTAEGAHRLCENGTLHGVCNWAVPADDPHPLCRACRLNETIPDLGDPAAKTAWGRMEAAKRRLLYTLLGLDLPFVPRSPEHPRGLAFAFIRQLAPDQPVMTGHADGLITINLAEADEVSRTRAQVELGESYRTLLGHFRHETGHYFWDLLIKETSRLDPFRELFGDERADYAAALRQHYAGGAPQDWQNAYVSTYASAHPWEDWAETWAHYLHMIDTLETARSYGLALRPRVATGEKTAEPLVVRRISDETFEDLVGAWVPVTMALNSFNRGMGLPDLYPFTLSARAIEKLRFVHEAIAQRAETSADAPTVA